VEWVPSGLTKWVILFFLFLLIMAWWKKDEFLSPSTAHRFLTRWMW